MFGVTAALVAAAAFSQTFEVVGDAIPKALPAEPGDAARGRSIVVSRDQGGCTLCHEVPGEKIFGNVAPTLAGVGAKLSAGQLRLRIADSTRVTPDTPMPSYYRTEGLRQVASPYQGRTILSAQQVEDVVAFLATLKGAK